jgi:hypothetical protein
MVALSMPSTVAQVQQPQAAAYVVVNSTLLQSMLRWAITAIAASIAAWSSYLHTTQQAS